MLRRWIPVLGMPVLVGTVLLVAVETAEAGLRDRLAARRANRGRGVEYSSVPIASTTPATTATTAPATTVTPSQSVVAEQPTGYYTTQARRFGRRGGRVEFVNTGFTTTPGATDSTRRSYYSGAPASAQLNVRLPASAELLIEGEKTKSTGPSRVLISPQLEPGQYTYELKAKWMENGMEMMKTRKVSFRPGDTVSIDFLAPSSEDK